MHLFPSDSLITSQKTMCSYPPTQTVCLLIQKSFFCFVLLAANCFCFFNTPPSIVFHAICPPLLQQKWEVFTRSLIRSNGSQDVLQSGGRWWLNEWVIRRSAFSTACWGGLHRIMCCAGLYMCVCVWVCVCVWTSVPVHVFQSWWTYCKSGTFRHFLWLLWFLKEI